MTRNAAFPMQFNLQLTFDFLLKTLSRYQGSVATLIISLKMIQPKWVEKEMNSIRNLISNRNNVYHIGFIPPRDLEFLVHLLKDQSLLFLHLCLTSLKAYKVIFSLSCLLMTSLILEISVEKKSSMMILCHPNCNM